MNRHLPGIRPGRGDTATREALAGEYVLGTLQGLARRRFERLLTVDGDLRRRVRAWEARLAPLAEEEEAVQPPAETWLGIRERLGRGGSGGAAVHPLWNSLALWRGLAMAATVLLAVVSVWAWSPGPAPMTMDRMAVVTNPERQPIWVVSADPGKGMLRVRTLRSPGMGPERVCPLWLKWDDGRHMHRAAILPEKKGVYTFKVPRDMPLDRARLAVSVESSDRVPRDRPRGQVVYQGDWIEL